MMDGRMEGFVLLQSIPWTVIGASLGYIMWVMSRGLEARCDRGLCGVHPNVRPPDTIPWLALRTGPNGGLNGEPVPNAASNPGAR
jgi:hypothetical protein